VGYWCVPARVCSRNLCASFVRGKRGVGADVHQRARGRSLKYTRLHMYALSVYHRHAYVLSVDHRRQTHTRARIHVRTHCIVFEICTYVHMYLYFTS
jgi:hypothetical protein